MKGYKGFEEDMSCKDMKYEVGKEYVYDGKVTVCKSGYHLCPRAIDVIDYYPPYMYVTGFSRYGYVEGSGDSDKCHDKIAFSKMTVLKELSLEEFIEHCLKQMKPDIDEYNIQYENKSANVVNNPYGISASYGDSNIVTTHSHGSCAVCTGHRSIARTISISSVATVTNSCSIALAQGPSAIAASTNMCSSSKTTGKHSIAVRTDNMGRVEAAGDDSVAVAVGIENTARVAGNGSVAVLLGSECKGISEGNGIVLCVGRDNVAKGKLGDYLIFADKDNNKITNVRMIYIDGENYKPDKWYSINDDRIERRTDADIDRHLVEI